MSKKILLIALTVIAAPLLAQADETPPGFEASYCSFAGNSVDHKYISYFKSPAVLAMVNQLCGQGNQMNVAISDTLAQNTEQPQQLTANKIAFGPSNSYAATPANNAPAAIAPSAPAPTVAAPAPAQSPSANAASSASNNIYGHS